MKCSFSSESLMIASSWLSKQRWKERISPQRMSPSTWSSLMVRLTYWQDEREARHERGFWQNWAFACYDRLICVIAGAAQSGNTCIWDCRGHEHLCRLGGDEGRRITSWRSRRSWQAATHCGEEEYWCSSRVDLDEHVHDDYNWWTIGFPRRS